MGAQDPLRLLARRLRPKPPVIDRSRIDQDFAVLLMRSSYSCAEGDSPSRDQLFFLVDSPLLF